MSHTITNCRHLGQPTGELRLCNTCKGKVQLKVFQCNGGHGKIVLNDCNRCHDNTTRNGVPKPMTVSIPQAAEPITHRHLKDNTPLPLVKQLLQQPPGPWPHGEWVGMPNVVQAMKELFHEASQNIPQPPEFTQERGIVICGGGWKFYPSLYVTIRMIRYLRCKLPIQVWYLGDRGEFDHRMATYLRDCNVTWVDGNAAWRERPEMRIRRNNFEGASEYAGTGQPGHAGWMMKPFAAAFSPFREVIYLDSDCYPAYDPERFMAHPEFQRVRASFWADRAPLEPGQWQRFGIVDHGPNCPGLESGQFVVDKGKHWKPLWLACWLNAYHDYVYRHVYGDKDTFNLSWRKLGHEMCIPRKKPDWSHVAFLHRDFVGDVLFIHRCRDKFRVFEKVDGISVPDNFTTSQHNKTGQIKTMTLPHEETAHNFAQQCRDLLRTVKAG